MKKKYRVWRVVINVLGHHLAVRCRHDTDNLSEVRAYYMEQRAYTALLYRILLTFKNK